MCFSHIQVKLTHVIQKCSTGPQFIFLSQIQVKLTHVFKNSQMFNYNYSFCSIDLTMSRYTIYMEPNNSAADIRFWPNVN